MCLAIPAEIVSVNDAAETAVVALGPVRKEISIALIENAKPGEFVLVHVGYALHKVSPDEAARTIAMMREAGLDPEIAEFGEAAR